MYADEVCGGKVVAPLYHVFICINYLERASHALFDRRHSREQTGNKEPGTQHPHSSPGSLSRRYPAPVCSRRGHAIWPECIHEWIASALAHDRTTYRGVGMAKRFSANVPVLCAQ